MVHSLVTVAEGAVWNAPTLAGAGSTGVMSIGVGAGQVGAYGCCSGGG